MRIAFQNYLNRIELLRKPVENHLIHRRYGWLHLAIESKYSQAAFRATRGLGCTIYERAADAIAVNKLNQQFSTKTGSDKLRQIAEVQVSGKHKNCINSGAAWSGTL